MIDDRIFLSPRARAVILWLTAAVLLLFLWEVRTILTPFIWAIVTAYVLNPVVILLARKTGLSRRVWSILFYVLLLGLLAWGLNTLVPMISRQVAEFIRELPEHFREAGRLLNQTEIEALGVRINLNASNAELSRQLTELFSQVGRNVLPSALPRVFENLLKLLVYLVSTFFLLLEADRIGQMIYNFISPTARKELGPWWDRINNVLGAYIRGQLFLVLLMSSVTYVGLTLLGVRFAPLLAIFTGLVETLPFIGPYIAGGTAVLVALTQGYTPYGWSPTTLAIAVAVMYTVLRQLEDNLVMPFLIGKLTHLHPLVVIFVVLAGAALGGILGLLVAVPLTATLKIVAAYLYGKFLEDPPRTLAMIERDDGWERIAAEVREAALLSNTQGASRPRLLLSVPYPPEALLDPLQFPRLPALLSELHSNALILSANAQLLRLAEEAGIGIYQPEEVAGAGSPPDDPDRVGGEAGADLRKGVAV